MDCAGSCGSNYGMSHMMSNSSRRKKKNMRKIFSLFHPLTFCSMKYDSPFVTSLGTLAPQLGFTFYILQHFTAVFANVISTFSANSAPSWTTFYYYRCHISQSQWKKLLKTRACHVKKAIYSKRTKEKSLSF